MLALKFNTSIFSFREIESLEVESVFNTLGGGTRSFSVNGGTLGSGTGCVDGSDCGILSD